MENFNTQFSRVFAKLLGFEPTNSQNDVIKAFADFVKIEKERKLFIMSGYAGTGKTTLIGNLVKSLKQFNRYCVLLAPTGRAAKVFSNFAEQKAYTIHKRIYRKQKIDNGSIQLVLSLNVSKNTIFIIDEASMIPDFSLDKNGVVGSRNLLEDLIQYVYSGENCNLIFVGDEGQLPPVGSDFSPALNLTYLKNSYPNFNYYYHKLDEVVRQSKESEILINATKIRSLKEVKSAKLKFTAKSDVKFIDGLELQDCLESAINFSGIEETIIITKSNKRANAYNQEVRKRILYFEEEITSNDLLMVVKNNYFWIPETSDAGFIANGEILKVKKVMRTEELYGINFIHLEVEMPDYPSLGTIKLIANLDTINSESPSMTREEMKRLFFEVEKDYLDERNKKIRYEKILANPYFNALQIKFAYAITCHKAQGGQWENVFLDHGYLTEEMMDMSFFRWLYTGFTRSKKKLYLINFSEEFK
jgi:exodeoxyribonuclease-5